MFVPSCMVIIIAARRTGGEDFRAEQSARSPHTCQQRAYVGHLDSARRHSRAENWRRGFLCGAIRTESPHMPTTGICGPPGFRAARWSLLGNGDSARQAFEEPSAGHAHEYVADEFGEDGSAGVVGGEAIPVPVGDIGGRCGTDS